MNKQEFLEVSFFHRNIPPEKQPDGLEVPSHFSNSAILWPLKELQPDRLSGAVASTELQKNLKIKKVKTSLGFLGGEVFPPSVPYRVQPFTSALTGACFMCRVQFLLSVLLFYSLFCKLG